MSRFHLILIKPTHYDSDGYPIQWRSNWIASNSLACINALALDCRKRKVLGPDIEIVVHTMDEISQRIPFSNLIRDIKQKGEKALLCLVGVQSNQFPRAMDISRRFLAAGIPIIIGGIHVSGCIAMLKELPPELKDAQTKGISLFAGEAEEGRLETVIKDAYADNLKPVYNYLSESPELKGQPVPILPEETLKRSGHLVMSIFDMGRGCPFKCSFCTIINVHGHKSRFRTPDDLERIIMENHKLGVHQFFITDDNLSRNANWSALFDRLIELKEKRHIPIRLNVQVDTKAHKIPGFIEKAVKAGVDQMFIGMESVNPENLVSAGKSQNNIEEYREMLLAWKRFPVVITAAYIIGFPADTPESIRRDIDFLKRELPIDAVYFTILTPLPGSADHKRLWEEGAWMDPDMNKFDTTNPVIKHPKMSSAELKQAYLEAWERFYTKEHMETIYRRMFALGSNKKLTTANRLAMYSYFFRYMNVHPIDGGLHPIRKRRDRRPTLPRENPFVFYPKNIYRVIKHHITSRIHLYRVRRLMWKINADPNKNAYRDIAIAAAFEKSESSSQASPVA